MKHNQRLGKWGEEHAAGYLAKHGFSILERNTRTPYGEIDIIAAQGDITVFVEVKSRSSNRMGLPEDSITPRKRQHMLSAAAHYAMEHAIDHWQIDVISIEGKPGMDPRITHFENAVT
jgi:putative endonuclease